MKHEIIEAKGETSSASAATRLGDLDKRQRIEELLRRYPDMSDDETFEIRHFLAKGNHLDVGLVAGSDEFGEKVRRFRKEHSRHFRPKPQEVLAFLAATLGPVAMLCWQYL